MNTTILVLGGTGLLGLPVSHGLNKAGFQVRILTRDRQKAQALLDDSFQVVEGDPLDANCLDNALKGCYGVHISLPGEVEQPTAERIARAAPRHGVKRITYISGASVAEERRWFAMVDRKFRAEAAIQASGVPYTIFGPTWQMESLPLFVVQGRASVLGKQPTPYHWVAADDLAQMVSAAYQQAAGESGRVIVFGPEAISMHDALRRYCAMFHPEIKHVSTMPFWLVKLLATLTRNSELKSVGEMMAYFEKVGEGNAQPKVNDVFGKPTTTLDQWLASRQV